MPRVKWSPEALSNTARLYTFLSEKNSEAAKRAIHAIREGVRALGRHPRMGRPVEELPEQFREWIVEFGRGAYILLYHFDAREVVILAVRHSREDEYS